MGGNAEKWWEMGGDGKRSVIAHGMWVVEGCGEKWDENGRKTGRNTHFSQSHFFPFSRRSKTFPAVPFVKISAPHLQRKMGIFATHRHSLPRRLLRMLGLGMTVVRRSMGVCGSQVSTVRRRTHQPFGPFDPGSKPPKKRNDMFGMGAMGGSANVIILWGIQ